MRFKRERERERERANLSDEERLHSGHERAEEEGVMSRRRRRRRMVLVLISQHGPQHSGQVLHTQLQHCRRYPRQHTT